jgi:hypothetical protein
VDLDSRVATSQDTNDPCFAKLRVRTNHITQPYRIVYGQDLDIEFVSKVSIRELVLDIFDNGTHDVQSDLSG